MTEIKKNPLRFKLVRGKICLSPNIIISASSSSCVQKTEIALDTFVDCHQMTAVTADKVKSEFCKFIAYKHESERLDVFYSTLMDKNINYQNLFMFVKNVPIMSHGNEAVESGFSINKAMLIENMQERSVIALQTVSDAGNSGGFKVDISKQIILVTRNAHSCYHEELKAKKLIEKKSEEQASKNKRAAEEKKELKVKKMKIQQEVDKQIAELYGWIKDLSY